MSRKTTIGLFSLLLLLTFAAACARRGKAPGKNLAVARENKPAAADDLPPVKTLSADENALLDAAAEGDLKKVQEIVGKGVNVNVQDNSGRAALIEAAFYGRMPVVKFLLEKGADPNVRKKDGVTVIMAAEKYPEIRELLLKAGAKEVKPELFDPLMEAARKGDVAQAKTLVAEGADVNGHGSDGSTPLIEAVYFNQPEMVKFLLENKADPNARKKDGATAFGFADKKPAIIEMLKNVGAK